jgi:hypothetical protein
MARQQFAAHHFRIHAGPSLAAVGKCANSLIADQPGDLRNRKVLLPQIEHGEIGAETAVGRGRYPRSDSEASCHFSSRQPGPDFCGELRCVSGEVNEIKQQNSCPFRTFRQRGRVPRREPAKPSLTVGALTGHFNKRLTCILIALRSQNLQPSGLSIVPRRERDGLWSCEPID